MRNPEFINWGYDYVTASSDPAIFGGIKDLAAAYRVFMQNMNRHTAFLTLSVSTEKRYVGTEIYESTTNKRTRFEKYLQAVMERFNPTLMSAEIFPIIKSDSAPYFTISDWYYFTLEVIGIYSSSYDAAFWLYMPSVQFKIYRDGSTAVETEYPLPTVSMLLFQAFNALAFGFQGLVFWTYALPENVLQKDSETGALIPKKEYINAPYNDGITTNIWNNCAVAIPGIKLFGKMLLGAKFIEAAHVYGPAYVRNPYPETRQMPASGIGCVLKATATGPGVVITRLEKVSEKYVAIVNHSPKDYEDFTLTVGPGCRWTEYRMMDWSDNYLTETEHQRESQEKTVSRMLQPGSMMLIKFEWA